MSARKNPVSGKKVVLYSVAAIGVIAAFAWVASALMSSGGRFSAIGSVHAKESGQSKDREGPAQTEGKTPEGKEAFREILEKLPLDEEFLRTLKAREDGIAKREREVARREKELELLQIAITGNLEQMEQMRRDLKAMTDKIDAAARKADKDREQKISDAIKRFQTMAPETAAEALLQMDLESGTAVLRQLRTGVGEIFDAMVEIADGGTDSKEKMAKLWEHLMNPEKPFEEEKPVVKNPQP